MAGRRVAGLGQLVVAVLGFCLFLGWFALLAAQTYNALVNGVESKSVAWLGAAGAGLVAASWFWSLATSLSVLREARAAEPPALARPDA
jgi:hypothetical protein